ncbi:hypothetical protein ACTXMK_05355 [Psychrobacter celer]|uniref:hypothetical protein n=1 Tax=Psychrobacter celer TaxID=306572 RepID=UPI003FD4F752
MSFYATLAESIQDNRKLKSLWIENLRHQGYKMAMPNDGWVDRENLTISLVYPHFNDGLNVGDKAVLGSHYEPKEVQYIKITYMRKGLVGGVRWGFKYID